MFCLFHCNLCGNDDGTHDLVRPCVKHTRTHTHTHIHTCQTHRGQRQKGNLNGQETETYKRNPKSKDSRIDRNGDRKINRSCPCHSCSPAPPHNLSNVLSTLGTGEVQTVGWMGDDVSTKVLQQSDSLTGDVWMRGVVENAYALAQHLSSPVQKCPSEFFQCFTVPAIKVNQQNPLSVPKQS